MLGNKNSKKGHENKNKDILVPVLNAFFLINLSEKSNQKILLISMREY